MKATLISYTQRIIKHELVSGSALLFVGTMGANVLAFLFNFVLVRWITPAEYGIFASMVSLITLLSVPNQFLTTTITQFATSFYAKHELDKVKALYKMLYVMLTIVSGVILFCFFLFLHQLQNFLHVTSSFAFIITGVIIGLSYLSIVNAAYLQSLLRFGYSAIAQVIGSAAKLGVGVFFLFLGWQSTAGIMAILGSYLAAFTFTQLPFLSYLTTQTKNIALPKKEIFFYSLPTALTIISLTSLTTTDVLLAKHFLPAFSAGIYAGMSLIGRVIFYFSAPITTVMFPLIVKKHAQQEKFQHLLTSAIGIVALMSFSIVVAYAIAPRIIIPLFLGQGSYIEYATSLWLFGLVASLFSLASVLVNFFLSTKHTNVVWLVTLSALLQIVLITVSHQGVLSIMINSLISLGSLLTGLVVYYWYSYARKKE